MRKLLTILALIAAPLHAQSGPQVLPQLSLDRAGSARTISVRDPVANTSRPIGTIDASGLTLTPSGLALNRLAGSTSFPIVSDFYNPSDAFAKNVNLLRSVDAETGAGKIRFNTMVQNLVVSNRINGPNQASVALGLTSIKPDFLTSTTTQEVDGLFVQTKSGLHGDSSAILGGATGIVGGDNYINLMEGAAYLVTASGAPVKTIRYQAAVIDQGHSISVGTNIVAEKGVIDYGVFLQSETLANSFSFFIYGNTANARKWSVDGQGNEFLAGSISASAVSVPQLTLQEVAESAVATPSVAGSQILFLDSADHKLKRKDAAGVVTVIG